MSARLLLIVSCILVVFGGSCVAKHEAMRPNFLLIPPQAPRRGLT